MSRAHALGELGLFAGPRSGTCRLLRASLLLLALLGREAMRRLRAAHAAVALSPRQFQLLGLLHDDGPTGQRELGELMRVDPSILVALLNDLESDGYVTRERAQADRRRHVVTITAAGQRHLERAACAQRQAEDELFADLDGPERKELEALLVSLRDSLADEPACA